MAAKHEQSKATRETGRAKSEPTAPYVPAEPRSANRVLVTTALILFGGWILFLIYAAIRATS